MSELCGVNLTNITKSKNHQIQIELQFDEEVTISEAQKETQKMIDTYLGLTAKNKRKELTEEEKEYYDNEDIACMVNIKDVEKFYEYYNKLGYNEALINVDDIITEQLDKSDNQIECQTLRWILDVLSDLIK